MLQLEKLNLAGGTRQSFGTFLGPLEGKILEILCTAGRPMRAKEIHQNMPPKSVQTSVAVMLDRLHDKGLVTREAMTGRGGTYYLYSPVGSKKEVERKVLATAVDRLVSAFGPSAVSYFNERFGNKKRA
ncbi:BlaI/MecI/CopY family transcriptional regulator [Candidatus Micrarchaeota archaeon]|nr:BlaI/MecI/CopY family transcriptional regulator [Candidatus Micrarchaeota archaeon]